MKVKRRAMYLAKRKLQKQIQIKKIEIPIVPRNIIDVSYHVKFSSTCMVQSVQKVLGGGATEDQPSIDAFFRIRDSLPIITSYLDPASTFAFRNTSLQLRTFTGVPDGITKAITLHDSMIGLIKLLTTKAADRKFSYRLVASLPNQVPVDNEDDGSRVLFDINVGHGNLFIVCDHHEAVMSQTVDECSASDYTYSTNYDYTTKPRTLSSEDDMESYLFPVVSDAQLKLLNQNIEIEFNAEFYTGGGIDAEKPKTDKDPLIHILELISRELVCLTHNACQRTDDLPSILESISYTTYSSISQPDADILQAQDDLLHFINYISSESKMLVAKAHATPRSRVAIPIPIPITKAWKDIITAPTDQVVSTPIMLNFLKIENLQERNAAIKQAIHECPYIDRSTNGPPTNGAAGAATGVGAGAGVGAALQGGGYRRSLQSDVSLQNTGRSITSHNVTRNVFLNGKEKCVKYKNQVLSLKEFKAQTKQKHK